jgi:Domain of unknown function (DUF222)
MSITALHVEALPQHLGGAGGEACLRALTARADAVLGELATAQVKGAQDPLGLAAWAKAAEAKLAAFRLAAVAEAQAQGAARKGGALGVAEWLTGQGSGAAAARREVALAEALADPAHAQARDALASGRVGAEQAAVVTAATAALTDAVSAGQKARFEKELLANAEGMDPWQLRMAARRAAARVDPTGSGDLAKAEKAKRAQRELVTYPSRGMVVLAGQLDPEGAAYLSAALDPLSAPRPSGLDGPDPRTPARRRGDALVELAQRAIAGGGLPPSGGTPTTVVVTMTLDQLLAAEAASAGSAVAGQGGGVVSGGGAAQVRGGTVTEPISAQRARRLACDAQILPAVLSGASHVLDWGRAKRLATPAQRQALALRDRGCTYPGCSRPPAWTEAHHLVSWLDHGLTDLANLALVCRAHHDLLHHDRWTLTYHRDTGVTWHPPGQPTDARPVETPAQAWANAPP